MATGLIVLPLLLLATGLVACSGEDRPPPRPALVGALYTERLLAGGPRSGRVIVSSLGYGGAELDRRAVPLPAGTRRQVLEAIAVDGRGGTGPSGLLDVARGLETGKGGEVGGVAAYPVSGEIDTGDLLSALGTGVGQRAAGLGERDLEDLRRGLVGTEFTVWVGSEDGRLQRIDLILVLDDPDNALPPSRIRIRLDEFPRTPKGT